MAAFSTTETTRNESTVKTIISVAQAVHHLRHRKGLSARQLSHEAGLSPSYVSKLESGEIDPSFEAFSALAVVLEMSAHEILVLVRCVGEPKSLSLSHPLRMVDE